MDEKTNLELTQKVSQLEAMLETLSARFDAQSKMLKRLSREVATYKAIELDNRRQELEELEHVQN